MEEREVRNGAPSASMAHLEEEDETLASRFVTRLLEWLFQGFQAKNKTVRYRAVSIVAEMIAHIGEIESVEMFTSFLII